MGGRRWERARASLQTLRQVAVACVAASVLAGCATLETPPPAPAPAPAVVSLDEWLNRGDAALKSNDHVAARDAFRAGAKDYPTAKQPWLKLAEDYFNAQDYGNAVLAAQEALQRDPRDRLAHSVLAVSGLRLTAGSLIALREDGAYPVGSRDEALAVTHSLREVLGEPVLVPQAEAPAAPVVHRRTARAAAGGASAAAPHAAAATPGPVPAPAPAPRATTAAAGNPLDKLK